MPIDYFIVYWLLSVFSMELAQDRIHTIVCRGNYIIIYYWTVFIFIYLFQRKTHSCTISNSYNAATYFRWNIYFSEITTFFFINMNNNYVFRFFLQTITLEMSLKNDFHIPFCTFAPLVGKDGRQSPRFIYTLLLQNDYRIKMWNEKIIPSK